MTANAKIQKFIPEQYRQVVSGFLPELCNALNGNVEEIEQTIQACIDQLFLSTASGKYLIQLGEESGFVMPENSGLDIRSYKVLIPIMVSSPKQVRLTIDDLIEAFYGTEKTKASVIAENTGPFVLYDGDFITVETEKGEVSVAITSDFVNDINNVSASEIASVLNSSQNIFQVLTDINEEGQQILKLSSYTRGSGSYVKVKGGTLQNVLKFPTIADTANDSTTEWNVTKSISYNDEVLFTWSGVGTNPLVYNADIGDFVSIRGVRDDLDGSFEIIDIGFDYFKIRNILFSDLSYTFTQTNDDIIFTKNQKVILFDKDEYALSTESENNSITVTVPAVPPLARRFLEGSAHIHGSEFEVLDFTRNSIQFRVPDNQNSPVFPNSFLLSSSVHRYNFKQYYYKVSASNDIPETPTYIIDSSGDDISVMPYTIPTLLQENPIYAEVGSYDYKLASEVKHGFLYAMGLTLQDATGESNITAALLNKEHYVSKIIDDYNLNFKILDTSGNPVKFNGVNFGSFHVYRHNLEQANGSDFYLEFPTEQDAIDSGLLADMTFKIDVATGTNIDPFWANKLKYSKLTVVSRSGNIINILAGYGTGPQGKIIDTCDGNRSAWIGGSSMKHYYDKTSSKNIDQVNTLKILFLEYSPELNENFIGPYVFDPDKTTNSMNISQYQASLNQTISRGSSYDSLIVNSITDGFPENGEFVIEYGTSKFEGPVRYFALLQNETSNQIIIDPSYKFLYSHDNDVRLIYLHSQIPYQPGINGKDIPFYVTGTTAARDTLFKLIDLLVAVGVFVEEDVLLPDLRYVDPSLNPFD